MGILTQMRRIPQRKKQKRILSWKENISNQKKTTSQGRDIDVTEYASQTMGQGQ